MIYIYIYIFHIWCVYTIYDKYTIISCYGKDRINCIDKTDYEYENHKVSINENKQNGLEMKKKFDERVAF